MPGTKKVTLLPLVLVLMGGNAIAQTYDVVINNGRVMDPETYYDAVSNVGIKDGRIV